MPQTLGKYLILNPLGSGATADVYQARDTVLGREVALKVLKPALVPDPQAFARFIQEAQAAAQLFHPHIATVLDIAETDGRYYIAMRYIPGRSLERILKEDGPLPWAEALRLAEHIGAALDYAHQQGFLHRDVKPSNIVRSAGGEYVLTDFGLTRAMMSTGLTSHTGAVLGTPAYIPPEIWQGETATPATDQYALACVVYEALTGQALFSGETPPAIMTAHVLKGARLPAAWPAGVPASATPALERALRPDPAARWGSVGEFVGALAAPLPPALPLTPIPSPLQGEGGKPDLSPVPSPIGKGRIHPSPLVGEGSGVRGPRRSPWKWVGLGVGLLLGLVVLLGLVHELIQANYDNQMRENARLSASQTAQALAAIPSLTPTPMPPALGIGATQISQVDGMVMSYIPAGSFRMGLVVDNFRNAPVHSVTLDAFWMDQTEVTNGMYEQCVAARACSAPNESSSNTHSSYYGDTAFANYPVIQVNWYQAEAYCAWAGRRLPSHEEWEKAARGGLEGANYPWGNDLPYCTLGAHNGAQYSDCSPDDTIAVASFAPNGYGLYDMVGNVWEFVAEWIYISEASAAENPNRPGPEDDCVILGGGWDCGWDFLQVVQEGYIVSVAPSTAVGFRCALTP